MALLTIDEASAKTRLSVSTLYKAVCGRRVPFVKLGARVLFDEVELDAWITAHRVEPAEVLGAR